jgi:TrkA-N domain
VAQHVRGQNQCVRAVFLVVGLGVVAGFATLFAHVVGGSVGETFDAVTDPDLVENPRGAAGLLAASVAVAGGVATLLALATSLRRPPEIVDDAAIAARVQNALTRLELRSVGGHVLVCGAGLVGQAIAEELAARAVDTIVVERNARVAGRARVLLPWVVEADPRDVETLRGLGAPRARGVVACAESDRENRRIGEAGTELGLPVVVAGAWPNARVAVDELLSQAAGS